MSGFHAWFAHMWPAVVVIGIILIGWALAAIPFSVLIGRMIAGPDARWPR